MKPKKILVWFRNDLRLHDNEMLVEAIAKSNEILPVYIFDPRTFHVSSSEPPVVKSGAIRTRFLQESVAALRTSFQQLEGDLLIKMGFPEEIIPDLVEQYDIAEVYHHREVAAEETSVSADVEDRLWKIQVNLRHFIGHTLYNKEDLPFPIKDIPDVFAQFKKKTERDAIVKACFLAPEVINFTEVADWGSIPELISLLPSSSLDEPVQQELIGGEQEGLKHLTSLLAPGSAIYLKTKPLPGRQGFSSRLSPWLAVGCLSPRMVYWMIKDAEEAHGAHPNFNQIILGLLWRDYFRFMFKKHGFTFFQELANQPDKGLAGKEEGRLLQQWKSGTTGHGLVDEYMQQLNTKGFIPNTGRLLLATYLIHVLKVDWTKGAAYFEEKSIDYAPANNWCNWSIVAGGSKPGDVSKSTFNLDKQLKILEVAAAI
ncbi:DASH family cryptochrome [Pedobacter sp.]|uniref:DASH family cryptochrome n=1 Tax=Pedobacter sp. TaxID=1411316 RepID=UPI003D7FC8EA